MKKLLLAFLLCSLSGFSFDYVHDLPNGHFAGVGNWTDNYGNSGSYSTYVELLNNEMRVDYAWDGESLTVFLSFWFTQPGVFDVIYQGDVIGSGSCQVGQCSYDTAGDGYLTTETLTFGYDYEGQPTLSKVGEKRVGGHIVNWQDGLYYVNFGDSEPVILPVPEPSQDPSQTEQQH